MKDSKKKVKTNFGDVNDQIFDFPASKGPHRGVMGLHQRSSV